MQTKYRTSRQDRASLGNITPGRRAAGAGYLNEPTARCPQCAFPNGVSRLRYIGCIQCGTRSQPVTEPAEDPGIALDRVRRTARLDDDWQAPF